jgi:hypothetical protein
MTGAEQISALGRKLEGKTQEILKLVAKSYGLGDVASLDTNKLQQLNGEIAEIIDQHEEALIEGDNPEAWRALDERLAQTEIGRLLQERHQISEQIEDLLDDDDDEGLGLDQASAGASVRGDDRPAHDSGKKPDAWRARQTQQTAIVAAIIRS